jgi:hypothetical protein
MCYLFRHLIALYGGPNPRVSIAGVWFAGALYGESINTSQA